MNWNGIIVGVKKKDKIAEKELFNLLSAKLYLLARRYAKDDAHAKDLLQECFMMIFSKVQKFDTSQAGRFDSWAYKVSLNVILSSLKSRKKVIGIDYLDELPETPIEEEAVSLRNISDEALMQAIQGLPSKYRLIVNLRIFEGYNYKEISDEVNVSVSTARSQMSRASAILRKMFVEPKLKQKDYG